MTDTPAFPASREDETRGAAKAAFNLEALPDDELKDLLKRGQAILAAREQERRAEAVREVQRLAAAHGLKVEVREPGRKRGRPRKAKQEPSP